MDNFKNIKGVSKMSGNKMDQHREELDTLNLELLELINKRAALVQEIGKIKVKQGMKKI